MTDPVAGPFLVGNTIRSTNTFVPTTGTVTVVTCRLFIAGTATPVDLTPAGTGNGPWTADYALPDTATARTYVFRWECETPHISEEYRWAAQLSSTSAP